MAEGRVLLTTFIEGVLTHGKAEPRVLLVANPHTPHRGLLMPVQVPWAPGFLPSALLTAQIQTTWGIPFRVVDKASALPVVFDERTSRLPTPWLLRLESLEGQQRLYLTHLLRAKAPDNEIPATPQGTRWATEEELAGIELVPGIRRLYLAAFQAAKEG